MELIKTSREILGILRNKYYELIEITENYNNIELLLLNCGTLEEANNMYKNILLLYKASDYNYTNELFEAININFNNEKTIAFLKNSTQKQVQQVVDILDLIQYNDYDLEKEKEEGEEEEDDDEDSLYNTGKNDSAYHYIVPYMLTNNCDFDYLMNLNIQNKTDREIEEIKQIIAFIKKQELLNIEYFHLQTLFSTPLENLENFFENITPLKYKGFLHIKEVTEYLKFYLENDCSPLAFVAIQERVNEDKINLNLDCLNINDLLFYLDDIYSYFYYLTLHATKEEIDKKDILHTLLYIYNKNKSVVENIEYFKQNQNLLITGIEDIFMEKPHSNIIPQLLADKQSTYVLDLIKKCNVHNIEVENLYLKTLLKYKSKTELNLIQDLDEAFIRGYGNREEVFFNLFTTEEYNIYNEMQNRDLNNYSLHTQAFKDFYYDYLQPHYDDLDQPHYDRSDYTECNNDIRTIRDIEIKYMINTELNSTIKQILIERAANYQMMITSRFKM